jgi:hypothetical protein
MLLCSALSVDAYYDVDSFDREFELYYASYLQSPIHDVAAMVLYYCRPMLNLESPTRLTISLSGGLQRGSQLHSPFTLSILQNENRKRTFGLAQIRARW